MRPTEEPTPSRRDFLKQSAVLGGTLVGLSASTVEAVTPKPAKRCILLMLTGGPSQIDTWDPKPQAPSEVRGPFNTIRTSVPGVHLSECFPLMAKQAHRFCVVRSMYHDAAPIHETGLQLMQTGHLATDELEYPHFNIVSASRHQQKSFSFGGPITQTGLNLSRGQSTGFFQNANHWDTDSQAVSFEVLVDAARINATLGDPSTVNMYSSLFGRVTWDCHADRGSLPTTLDDYRNTVCPSFDLVFIRLLDKLADKGLLDSTLVIAMGEMGRNPFLNSRGGRDHWTRAWSILLAGAGIPGGAVIGATDRLGGEVVDTPIHPRQLVATIYRLLGVDLGFDSRFDELRRTPSIPGLG
jgi:hypothetical protein